MRAINIVDKQISNNLVQLNLTQKENFEDEMNKRFAELENGTVKGFTSDEALDHARLNYKSLKKKK